MKKQRQAPLPSTDRVVCSDILHFSPKTEQYPQHQIGYHNEGPLPAHLEEDSPKNYHNSKYSYSILHNMTLL